MPMFGPRRNKSEMVAPKHALPGRDAPIPTAPTHFVTGRPLDNTVPPGMACAMFGMGCFWGAERLFWQLDGVYLTMTGYAGGSTPNPTYHEVCTGNTGHAEVVWLVHDPAVITYDDLLRVFWQGHDPTQGMAQGNDRGTQYRSAIFTSSPAQKLAAEASRAAFQARLSAAGLGAITSEITDAPAFYHAEDYHQQYLAKNPDGYCGLGGTGVRCPVGAAGVTGG